MSVLVRLALSIKPWRIRSRFSLQIQLISGAVFLFTKDFLLESRTQPNGARYFDIAAVALS